VGLPLAESETCRDNRSDNRRDHQHRQHREPQLSPGRDAPDTQGSLSSGFEDLQIT
jgi:hypothetical protein